jgi:ABC-type multidrug transport system fused ATPase/permease subunit
MKTGSFFSNSYSALILKVVGVVLILGTLLDYVVLAVPPDFSNSEWFANLINEWVSRAAVPLLGLALLFLGVRFDRNSEAGFKGLPVVAIGLSALLGIVFLILAPLYFNSSRLTSAAQTRQINEQAAQAERQLNNLLAQQRARVSAIVSNEDQLARLQQQLDSLDLSEEQQAQLKQIRATLDKVKSDPKALDQEVAKARTEGINQIKQKQTEALDELQSELRRNRLHTTLSSLIFSVGYLLIAWIGLGGAKAPARKRR